MIKILLAFVGSVSASHLSHVVKRKHLNGHCYGEAMHGAGNIEAQVLDRLVTTYIGVRMRGGRADMRAIVAEVMGDSQKTELMEWIWQNIVTAPVALVDHLLNYNGQDTPAKWALEVWDEFRSLHPAEALLTSCHAMYVWNTAMVEHRAGQHLTHADLDLIDGFYRIPAPLTDIMRNYITCLQAGRTMASNTPKRTLEAPQETSKRQRTGDAPETSAAATMSAFPPHVDHAPMRSPKYVQNFYESLEKWAAIREMDSARTRGEEIPTFVTL